MLTTALLLGLAIADPAPVRLGEATLAPETVSAVVEAIETTRLHAAIAHLSDDSFYGRFFRSPFAFKAAEWIRDQFHAAGLQPGIPAPVVEGEPRGEASWFQPIADPEAAPNVVALLPGRSDRVVLVTAHYDHLPPLRRGENRIFNGADDNASGTCGMIAIAQALAALPARPPCTVLFVAFTGEEAGLLGSRHFVRNLPIAKERIVAVLNMDMISRGDPNTIFVDGMEISEGIRAALRAANAAIGLNIRFDEHPEWLPRSDQGPFLAEGIPAVLFSVEDHEDYHKVTDTADRIIPELAAKVSRLVALATLLLGEQALAADAPAKGDGAAAPAAPTAPSPPQAASDEMQTEPAPNEPSPTAAEPIAPPAANSPTSWRNISCGERSGYLALASSRFRNAA